MTKKAYYTWEQVEGMTQDILQQIRDEKFDAVVGLTRGGLTPAVLVSQYLDIPMHTLKVSLRDHQEKESLKVLDKLSGQKVLVIDDINDTGATFNWIMQDWPSGCLPSHEAWLEIWNYNVKFAVLVDNLASKCDAKIDFYGREINKAEDDLWVDFPWESWWGK